MISIVRDPHRFQCCCTGKCHLLPPVAAGVFDGGAASMADTRTKCLRDSTDRIHLKAQASIRGKVIIIKKEKKGFTIFIKLSNSGNNSNKTIGNKISKQNKYETRSKGNHQSKLLVQYLLLCCWLIYEFQKGWIGKKAQIRCEIPLFIQTKNGSGACTGECRDRRQGTVDR